MLRFRGICVICGYLLLIQSDSRFTVYDSRFTTKCPTASVIGHGDGDFGIGSGVRWYPDSGNYTIIVLSNYDRGGIITIYKLEEMIPQQAAATM